MAYAGGDVDLGSYQVQVTTPRGKDIAAYYHGHEGLQF